MTIRSLLVKALYKYIRHVDIKIAFLHGEVQENVYMHQPESYVVSGQEQKVCRLTKAIYGLKQAARAWNLNCTNRYQNWVFAKVQPINALYIQTTDNTTIYVIVYLDDFLIAGEDKNINKLISNLNKEYPVTDLGEAKYYFEININLPNKNYDT